MRDHDYSTSSEFLANFFGETTEHAVEIRALPNERGASRAAPLFTRDPQLIEDHCARWDRPERAMYFGVATRLSGSPDGTRASLAELPALWVDIDTDKLGLDKAAVAASLREKLLLPPSIIVDSGGGIHAYWLFTEALDVRAGGGDAADTLEHDITAALKQLAGICCGDTAVCDLARVMRLPGSHNTKTAGEMRLTAVIEAHWQRRYEFSDLVEMLDNHRPAIERPAAPAGARAGGGDARPTRATAPAETDPFLTAAQRFGIKPSIDVDERLQRMSYMADGTDGVHETQRDVSASMVGRGASDDEIVDLLLAATKVAAGHYAANWNWRREERNLRNMIDTWRAKIESEEKEKVPAVGAKQPEPAPQQASSKVVQLRSSSGAQEKPVEEERPATIETPSNVTDLVALFNKRYMVVNEAGKAIVYEPTMNERTGRRHYWRITFQDFERLYANLQIVVGKQRNSEPIVKPAGKVWLNHPNRRQYLGGVVFDPTGAETPPGALNLWQGFAITPSPEGSWAKLREHTLQIICAGNEKYFNFLMGWMARLVQFPAEQGEVAVVLKSGEGAGKGTLVRALLRILGQHGLAISNAKHLVGAFNEHLRDSVLLFADEAFWAGDRAHMGVLKALITEPSLMIEGKHQNATQTPNYVHLMMASNERWVVPAGMDSRRFFVLIVSDKRAKDYRYFAEISGEMDKGGGHAAMLHDLLNYDLSDYNPRDIPVTQGLQDQRKLSLPVAEEWWQEVLYRGYVFKSKLGLEEYFSQWYDVVTTEVLYEAYTTYAKFRNERYPMAREEFGRFMVKMGGRPTRPRNAVVGEHIADVQNSFGGVSRAAKLITDPRSHGYRVGTLREARDGFLIATKIGVDWPSDDPGDGDG